LNSGQITESYGDFRVGVEGRLTKLETELNHKVNQDDITKLKFWVVSGLAAGLFAILLVILSLTVNLTKIVIEIIK
jgi:hypothetical protein